MKSEKTKKTVADMGVLKDIRGLLSTTQDRKTSANAELTREADLGAEIVACKEEIERYKQLTVRLEQNQERLRRENEGLRADLEMLRSRRDEAPVSATASSEGLKQEIVDLEGRRLELASTLSKVEDVLRLRLQELLKRIERVHQEIGASGLAVEFRRTADQIQNAETFAQFVRGLIGE